MVRSIRDVGENHGTVLELCIKLYGKLTTIKKN